MCKNSFLFIFVFVFPQFYYSNPPPQELAVWDPKIDPTVSPYFPVLGKIPNVPFMLHSCMFASIGTFNSDLHDIISKQVGGRPQTPAASHVLESTKRCTIL